jgi:hypothetical protein
VKAMVMNMVLAMVMAIAMFGKKRNKEMVVSSESTFSSCGPEIPGFLDPRSLPALYRRLP